MLLSSIGSSFKYEGGEHTPLSKLKRKREDEEALEGVPTAILMTMPQLVNPSSCLALQGLVQVANPLQKTRRLFLRMKEDLTGLMVMLRIVTLAIVRKVRIAVLKAVRKNKVMKKEMVKTIAVVMTIVEI